MVGLPADAEAMDGGFALEIECTSRGTEYSNGNGSWL